MVNTRKAINMIVVCGPTASGKTRLGVLLAEKLKGEIISADSRQVYRTMDIGTGKDLNEYRTTAGIIPYHLIDIADPEELYSLYRYIEDFYRAFRRIEHHRKMAVVVGGTGLYVEAVLKQYRVANVPENKILRAQLMEQDKDELAEKLYMLDSALHRRTDLTSKKRIVRALEVAEYAQSAPVCWGGETPPEFNPIILGVRWPREALCARIDMRLQERLEQGMLDEVEKLLARGISRERMLSFGMEYKYSTRYLLREISYTTMVDQLRTSIHRLAKRQMTWFRGMERRGMPIHWIDCAEPRQVFQVFTQYHISF